MPHYDYLIIGGGMTANAAVKGIRSVDKSGTIGIVSDEQHPPYKRPPLSKALWKGDPIESIWLNDATEHASIHTSCLIKKINVKEKKAINDSGDTFTYTRLLLATGGSVRKLPYEAEGVIYYRTLNDFNILKQRTKSTQSIVVIGGGFIGSEIAASLAMNNQKVTMIFPQDGIGARVYPPSLSMFLNKYYKSKGVDIYAGESVSSVTLEKGVYKIKTSASKEIPADIVVAGIGIQPNTELAEEAGIKVANGITVNEVLQTSDPDVYAAGDVAGFFNPSLGKTIRVEHEDNALAMGETAGKNMAGAKEAYHHLPFFYSDLFDLGYEAVGELNNKLEVVEDWKEEFKEGVVYYLEQQRVRGVLLWNTWGQLESARSLIAEKGPFTGDTLKGRIA